MLSLFFTFRIFACYECLCHSVYLYPYMHELLYLSRVCIYTYSCTYASPFAYACVSAVIGLEMHSTTFTLTRTPFPSHAPLTCISSSKRFRHINEFEAVGGEFGGVPLSTLPVSIWSFPDLAGGRRNPDECAFGIRERARIQNKVNCRPVLLVYRIIKSYTNAWNAGNKRCLFFLLFFNLFFRTFPLSLKYNSGFRARNHYVNDFKHYYLQPYSADIGRAGLLWIFMPTVAYKNAPALAFAQVFGDAARTCF